MTKRANQTKITDSKGRLTLGEAFANRSVIVEPRGDENVLHLARVIPEREAWLYENPTALHSVRRGLKQAKGKKFSAGPDLGNAAKLAEKLRAAAQTSATKHAKDKKAKATKAEARFQQVEKCIRLLLQNPRHPGLPTHEFHSIDHPYENDGKVFEAYVQNNTPGAYRLFWCYGPKKGELTIIAITPHP